jgi:DnaJ-class molecular chaperone
MEELCQKCQGKGIIYEKDGKSHTCFDCLQAGKLTNFHYKFEKEDQVDSVCQKCNGKGIVKEANGSSHTCWDCLQAGRLDNHTRNLQDSNIKL